MSQAVAALESDSRTFEVIVVDDGSRDGSWADDRAAPCGRRAQSRLFASSATSASTRRCTRDSSARAATSSSRWTETCRTSPPDLPKLIARRGERRGRRHPAAARAREDSWGRTLPSKLINGMLRRFTVGRHLRLRLRLQRLLARRAHSRARRHRQAEVHQGARPRGRRQRRRGRPRPPRPRRTLALLAASPDQARPARPRGLLAPADPVGRGASRNALRDALARRRRLGDGRLDPERRLPRASSTSAGSSSESSRCRDSYSRSSGST